MIKDLIPRRGADDEADPGEGFEFALNGTNAGIYLTGNLPGIEGLVSTAVQERQYGAPRTTEQRVPQAFALCTHSENNCTQYEYEVQGPQIGIFPELFLENSPVL